VGFDFLGEANQWPNHGSQAGLFDTRGFKKTAAWQQQALWSETPMVAIGAVTPASREDGGPRRRRFERHWTWSQGTGSLRVMAFSNCERVELRLNGRTVAERPVGSDRTVSFQLDYQPGELAAVGYHGAAPVATNTLVTAGEPAALRVELDRPSLPADGLSVAHAVVSVVDASGNVVPSARHPITIELEGAGRLLGVDNGDQNDPTALSSRTRKANGGQVLVLLQSAHASGNLTLRASTPGLRPAVATLSATD
jgi:beta-galactosidase